MNTGARLPEGWRRCEGGPAEVLIPGESGRCPGCGFLFATLMDEPRLLPHIVNSDHSVTFIPER